MNYVIGCGGVGSWLVPKLRKLTCDLVLIDGDTLEFKNLDRQLFTEDEIGMNKAEALSKKYGAGAWQPVWFHAGLLRLKPHDVLLCCADNSAARLATLQACDEHSCRAVIGANEYTDAEAYWYESQWAGMPNDPRVFYPSILTDRADDPIRGEACTGPAAVKTPQLVLANDWASGLMLALWWFHIKERPELDYDTMEFWPVHHKGRPGKFLTIQKGQRPN